MSLSVFLKLSIVHHVSKNVPFREGKFTQEFDHSANFAD